MGYGRLLFGALVFQRTNAGWAARPRPPSRRRGPQSACGLEGCVASSDLRSDLIRRLGDGSRVKESCTTPMGLEKALCTESQSHGEVHACDRHLSIRYGPAAHAMSWHSMPCCSCEPRLVVCGRPSTACSDVHVAGHRRRVGGVLVGGVGRFGIACAARGVGWCVSDPRS